MVVLAAAKRVNLGSPVVDAGVESVIHHHSHAPPAPSVTSRDLRSSRQSRRVRSVNRPVSPPPTATIQALIDMGFNRRAAEHALKALGGQGDVIMIITN